MVFIRGMRDRFEEWNARKRGGGVRDRGMRRFVLIPLFLLRTTLPLLAVQDSEAPELHGEFETSVDLKYKASERLYVFHFPLYWTVGIGYEDAYTEAMVSVRYVRTLDIGETYVLRKSGVLAVKLGYYVEDWGIAHSFSPISILNERDSEYPQNIFYRRFFRPNPILSLTLEGEKSYDQVLISNRDENIESIDDTLFGIRKVWGGSDFHLGLGAVRKIGFPPILYSLSAKRESEGNSAWIELGLEYEKEKRNVWNFVIGGGKELLSTAVYAEYIIDGACTFFFLKDRIFLGEKSEFEIRGFFHIPDLSFAFHLFFLMELGRSLVLEPGVFLFLGQEGDYFSNQTAENDNSVYVKLRYTF